MEDAPRPGLSRWTARPPYEQSVMQFRAAVYTNPHLVSLQRPAGDPGAEADNPLWVMWISEMSPGDRVHVTGSRGEHTWTAIVTAEADGMFSVQRDAPLTNTEPS